jgi:outer membrane protein OmpA-like peptidoglycan-associated protein
MPLAFKRLALPLLLSALAACTPMAPPPSADADRLLVYFDEFSADLSPDAQRTIADAGKRARDISARRIRIEGRASATGSLEANKRLAETRTQVVADELMKDGVPKPVIWQVPIGQTGSGDPGIFERRVDLVLER